MFDKMLQRNVVSFNTMIDGYGKNGKCELAEELFMAMTVRDVVTWTRMISALSLIIN